MPFLHCSSVDPIRFMKPKQDIFLPAYTVHVWKIPVSGMRKGLLSDAEMAHADRFRSAADKNRFTTGRQMLKLLSSKYLSIPPEEVAVIGERHKKPIIANLNKRSFYFNLSHSGQWILIAFSESELGVDLEKIDQKFSFHNIVRDQFCVPEQDFIFKAPEPVHAFYLLWTRKEALLKAWGLGLQPDLRIIPSLNGIHPIEFPENNSWQVNSFHLADYYQAAVAYTERMQSVSYFDGSDWVF